MKIKNDYSAKKVVSDDPLDVERRQKVKEAMLHAWSSYEKYAWGQDELQVFLDNTKNILLVYFFLNGFKLISNIFCFVD